VIAQRRSRLLRARPAAAGARRSLRERPALLALAGVLLVGFVLRAALGLTEMGLYWPDEVRQSLEPAHDIVFGYGILPWEYTQGARSWAFPGLLAAFLWPLQAVGFDDPAQYLPAFRLLFILVALATAAGIYGLVRVLGGSVPAALAGAAAFALTGPIVYFGHRALSETASALPVVVGFALALAGSAAWERDRTRARRLLLAGAALLGLAVLLRLQVAVLCVGLVALLGARRQWRAAAEATGVLAACALALGLLDLATYGGLFHSARTYVEFNLLENGAAQWGTQPFGWYVDVLWRGMPLVVLLLAAGLLGAARRTTGLVVLCVAFFLLHSWTPHKELRFLLPVLPLVIAVAAVGLERIAVRLGGVRAAPVAAVALGVAGLASGLEASKLDFRDVGAYEAIKPDQTAWDDYESVNRLLLAAHDRPDLCGIKVETAESTFSGGLSHLHRDVPYVSAEGPGRESGLYNYVIAPAPPAGDRSVEIHAVHGGVALLRIRDGCATPPRG
jgi:GPI mannosyltransferase 3